MRDQFRVIGTEGELNLSPLNGPTLQIATAQGTTEEHLPTDTNVRFPAIENFVSAAFDGAPLACPIDQAIWTDWVTQQVKDAQ